MKSQCILWLSSLLPPVTGPLVDDGTLTTITSTNPGLLDISKIPSTWVVLAAVGNDTEARTASSQLLTALILIAHSNMWDWFSQHVTEPIHHLLQVPITSHNDPNVQEKMPNNWIFPPFRKIQLTLLLRSDVNLVTSNFIEGLDAPDHMCTAQQSGHPRLHQNTPSEPHQ
jgi:hypothetical protein